MVDDGRTDDGRRTPTDVRRVPAYPLSSPGELTKLTPGGHLSMTWDYIHVHVYDHNILSAKRNANFSLLVFSRQYNKFLKSM